MIHQSDCSTTGDDGVREVVALKNLKSLIIQDFQSGGGAIDAGMDVLRDFPNLQRLELTGLPAMSHKRLDPVLGMEAEVAEIESDQPSQDGLSLGEDGWIDEAGGTFALRNGN